MNEPVRNPLEPLDPLDALLQASRPTLADEGFTNRVLLALPPRRRRVPLRLALLTTALVGATVLLVLQGHALIGRLPSLAQQAHQGDLAALLPLLPVLGALGSLGWALAAVALEDDWA